MRTIAWAARFSPCANAWSEHRSNPACAGCHKIIDPAGFALENFDAVGRWRDADNTPAVPWVRSEVTAAIDASGVLPDGSKFNGPAELRQALFSDPSRFVTTLTTKLMTYALGRGVEYYDMPAIRAIVRDAAADDNHFSDADSGRRGEPAISDEEIARMNFVTKKALPRRAFLRGAGSAMIGLPLLESMVPALYGHGSNPRQSGQAARLCLYSQRRLPGTMVAQKRDAETGVVSPRSLRSSPSATR